MNLEDILKGLDNLFNEHKIDEIAPYLEKNIKEAIDRDEDGIVLSLLNELIGFLRDVSRFDECIAYCNQILKLIDQMGLKGTYPYATSMLNVANAYRAAGLLEESRKLYTRVVDAYKQLMDEADYRFAPLYNNMSLLEQECNDFDTAVIYLKKALDIVVNIPEKRIETAITHTNLAVSLLKLNRLSEAMGNLKAAFDIFEENYNQTGERDFHYMAALSAMAEALYMSGDSEGAASYYRFALQEIEKNTGKSAAYEITLQNLERVERELYAGMELENVTVYEEDKPQVNGERNLSDDNIDKKGDISEVNEKNSIIDDNESDKSISVISTGLSGMELCEKFYYEFGAPMIAEKFPEYESDIAVGLVGEGSECLGFDDEVSRDHDFGPGFCIWITDAIYEKIGEELQKEYDKLPKTYMGLTRRTTPKAGKRVGVFSISEFYEKYIGTKDVPATENQWLFLEDYQLKNVTNGKVFRDDLGEFSRIRKELLKGYPENVRIKKIARQAALIAQSGQYNFGRMLGRGDTVAAQIALAEFSRNTMKMVYLLNKVYAPFYKWLRRGMEDLNRLAGIGDLLDAISSMIIHDERIPGVIERIVEFIIAEMKRQSLTTSDETFLDAHTNLILNALPDKSHNETRNDGAIDNMQGNVSGVDANTNDTRPIKERLITELIQLEWEAFDKTENEGGRASCQNDFGTFNVMRRSQYLQWEIPMLASFIEDFKLANNCGRNLITEKYGRMMASTAPVRYEEIKSNFPLLDEDRIAIQEAIIALQVGMMEECAKKYPKSATNARSIHTYEDNPYNTSYETYLRGELGTYSEKTLELYGRFMAKIARDGRNLAMEIIENTAKMYGYAGLDDLESKIKVNCRDGPFGTRMCTLA